MLQNVLGSSSTGAQVNREDDHGSGGRVHHKHQNKEVLGLLSVGLNYRIMVRRISQLIKDRAPRVRMSAIDHQRRKAGNAIINITVERNSSNIHYGGG
jgi:hypothetical protein